MGRQSLSQVEKLAKKQVYDRKRYEKSRLNSLESNKRREQNRLNQERRRRNDMLLNRDPLALLEDEAIQEEMLQDAERLKEVLAIERLRRKEPNVQTEEEQREESEDLASPLQLLSLPQEFGEDELQEDGLIIESQSIDDFSGTYELNHINECNS